MKFHTEYNISATDIVHGRFIHTLIINIVWFVLNGTYSELEFRVCSGKVNDCYLVNYDSIWCSWIMKIVTKKKAIRRKPKIIMKFCKESSNLHKSATRFMHRFNMLINLLRSLWRYTGILRIRVKKRWKWTERQNRTFNFLTIPKKISCRLSHFSNKRLVKLVRLFGRQWYALNKLRWQQDDFMVCNESHSRQVECVRMWMYFLILCRKRKTNLLLEFLIDLIK